MILITCASSILTSSRKGGGSRVRRSRRAVVASKLADTLFYRRVGVAGTIGRLGLLMISAVLSYFVGAGLAELMLKAPVPVALMFAAAFLALAGGGADRR